MIEKYVISYKSLVYALQTNDRTGEKEIQGQETTENSSYSTNKCKKRCTKPKENVDIVFKGLTSQTYEVDERKREKEVLAIANA
jgi:hypothetical protein